MDTAGEESAIHAVPPREPMAVPEITSVELRLGLWLAPLAHRPSSPLLRYLEQAREALNDSGNQMAVSRSTIAEHLDVGRSQGIQLDWVSDNARVMVA